MSDKKPNRKKELKAATTDLIRQKMSNIYEDEPEYAKEVREIELQNKTLSKHQEYIEKLNQSGKTSFEIQRLWHEYYDGLSNEDKKQVWDEFYKSNAKGNEYFEKVSKKVRDARKNENPDNIASKVLITEHILAPSEKKYNRRIKTSSRKLSESVKHKTNRVAKSQFIKSLGFGLIIGTLVIIIFLFSFLNQIFLIPFIQPSRNAITTPIILDTSGLAANTKPEIIIPKLNLEIPVNYTEVSTNETNIENDLNSGVVHYPSTVFPGQIGNSAYFGHSSNNIFNPGKYKFAFVLLHTLVKGDTFYLVYNSRVYVYQVFSKIIVPPSEVSVLDSVPNHTATVALITCDPPGTSINRLVVYADQINPNLNTNSSPTNPSSNQPVLKSLPGNGQSLWSKFINWL